MLETTTIKQQIVTLIQAGEESPDVIGKRLGLNGHDLVKNLEQLRKEGQINLKWGPGDRIERVRINRGALNLNLLDQNGSSTKALYGENVTKLAEAINAMPWEGEWRKWDVATIRRFGLDAMQTSGAMRVLRETGRVVQLGGGHRGVPIKGVRWRNEPPPAAVLEVVPVETATEEVQPPPEPSYAVARQMLKRWKQMSLARDLLKQTGKSDIMDALTSDPELRVMDLIGPDVERLLKTVE